MFDAQEPYLRTSLTVDEFGRFFGLNPWILHQFLKLDNQTRFNASNTVKCDDPVYQFQYNDDKMSRYDISRAILDAELTLLDYLNYYPGVGWITDEPHDVNPNLCDGHNWAILPCGVGGHQSHLLRTTYGNVRQFGTERLTSIATDVVITRVSSTPTVKPAGFLDRFTMTFPVPDDTEACELALFYAATDLGELPQETWEIRPIKATVDSSGGAGAWTATITGPAYLLVRPEELISPTPTYLQADDPNVYITIGDVFQRDVNSDEAGIMYWDASCTVSTRFTCHDMYEPKMGYFTPFPYTTNDENDKIISYPSICSQYGQTSNRIMVNYISGCDLKSGCNVNSKCKMAVAYLAAANLQCLPCGCACENNDERLGKYGRPPMYKSERGLTFTQMRKSGECPFGDSYGAIKAWEIARRIKLKRPVMLTA